MQIRVKWEVEHMKAKRQILPKRLEFLLSDDNWGPLLAEAND